MKQNLTRKPVISRFFSVTGITGITGLIFSVRESFLRSWVNNLTVLKRSGLGHGLTGLGLEKVGGLGLVTWWSCYITGPNPKARSTLGVHSQA